MGIHITKTPRSTLYYYCNVFKWSDIWSRLYWRYQASSGTLHVIHQQYSKQRWIEL